MNDKPYLSIVRDVEAFLERHGDSYLGVGWTKRPEYAALRYRIMLEVIRPGSARPVSLLDFGCGAAHLLEYIKAEGLQGIDYSGLDLSNRFLALSRGKHPGVDFHQVDLLDPAATLPSFDYVVMNGIFTYRGGLDHEAMWRYCQALLLRVAKVARVGFAFNVMTKYLDWERDDLFHLPLDTMARFVADNISRAFTVRHDYGLYEYTVYVYHRALVDEIPV